MKINYGKILKYLYFFSILFVFINIGVSYLLGKQVIFADTFKSTSLDAFVNDFYPWAMTISASLAIIMLIYSGYLFVTSAGNTEQVNKAKEYIVGALSGLAFLMLAGMILQTIQINPSSSGGSTSTTTSSNNNTTSGSNSGIDSGAAAGTVNNTTTSSGSSGSNTNNTTSTNNNTSTNSSSNTGTVNNTDPIYPSEVQ